MIIFPQILTKMSRFGQVETCLVTIYILHMPRKIFLGGSGSWQSLIFDLSDIFGQVKVKSTYTGIVSSISSSTSDIEEIPLRAMPKSFFLLFRESLASTLPHLLILSAPLVFFLYKLFFSILFYSRGKSFKVCLTSL